MSVAIILAETRGGQIDDIETCSKVAHLAGAGSLEPLKVHQFHSQARG